MCDDKSSTVVSGTWFCRTHGEIYFKYREEVFLKHLKDGKL